jgi:hypothetical protein
MTPNIGIQKGSRAFTIECTDNPVSLLRINNPIPKGGFRKPKHTQTVSKTPKWIMLIW